MLIFAVGPKIYYYNEEKKKLRCIFVSNRGKITSISYIDGDDYFAFTDDGSIYIFPHLTSNIKSNVSITKNYVFLHPRNDIPLCCTKRYGHNVMHLFVVYENKQIEFDIHIYPDDFEYGDEVTELYQSKVKSITFVDYGLVVVHHEDGSSLKVGKTTLLTDRDDRDEEQILSNNYLINYIDNTLDIDGELRIKVLPEVVIQNVSKSSLLNNTDEQYIMAYTTNGVLHFVDIYQNVMTDIIVSEDVDDFIFGCSDAYLYFTKNGVLAYYYNDLRTTDPPICNVIDTEPGDIVLECLYHEICQKMKKRFGRTKKSTNS